MMEVVDHTVHHSVQWRHCRIVSRQNIKFLTMKKKIILFQNFSSWSSVQSISHTRSGTAHYLMEPSLRTQWYRHNVSSQSQYQWSIELHQHISHTAHTEGPPSQHCCYIQCQSIHHHRTRRSCVKQYINY